MLRQLRCVAGELLASYARQAAQPPPAAAAVAAAAGVRLPPALQQARWARGSGGDESQAADSEPLERQSFSEALRQLEAAVTETALPQDALAENRKAMHVVKEFARALDVPYSYPPSMAKRVTFVFRDSANGGRLHRVRALLKTSGGDSSAQVQERLGQLLGRLGLNPQFYFDGGQFKPKPMPRQPRPLAQPKAKTKPRGAAAAAAGEQKPSDVQAVRAKAAAAGFPSQTISEEEFRRMQAQSEATRAEKARKEEAVQAAAERMRKIDPLLAAVAAVPWLALMKDKEAVTKVGTIKTQVMDEIESWGWDVRGPVRRIWDGERSLVALQRGKDAGSQEAIKTILFHAVQNDNKYGKRTDRKSVV